uniref:Uncharacterized protein n=1 Tax=Arundo donax TaxID=35708 RepID=A0A0A9CH82_ARUDO
MNLTRSELRPTATGRLESERSERRASVWRGRSTDQSGRRRLTIRGGGD